MTTHELDQAMRRFAEAASEATASFVDGFPVLSASAAPEYSEMRGKRQARNRKRNKMAKASRRRNRK